MVEVTGLGISSTMGALVFSASAYFSWEKEKHEKKILTFVNEGRAKSQYCTNVNSAISYIIDKKIDNPDIVYRVNQFKILRGNIRILLPAMLYCIYWIVSDILKEKSIKSRMNRFTAPAAQ